MSSFSNIFTPKNTLLFNCNICDFHTCNKKDFTRHIETVKHSRNINQGFFNKITQKKHKHVCSHCGKEYNDYSGLWRHSKKCKIVPIDDELTNKELILQILKQNAELIKENSGFKLLMIEQNKTLSGLVNTTNNNSNTNN